jgi:exopolysaccharide biosynthesis polyprenyl glycosylphosphotransferase
MTDILWLLVGVAVATKRVFGVWMPWLATTPSGTLMPSAGLALFGAIVSVYVAYRVTASTLNRPSYGQAVAIVGLTAAISTVGLVVSREYWSREWLIVCFGLWLAALLGHRFLYRQLDIVEPMTVITNERSLADAIDQSPFASVDAVVAPNGDPSRIRLTRDSTLVVDLRSVLSPAMAQFVSSTSLSGHSVRPLVDVFEEFTGRLPIVHLVDGWELTRPVSRSGYTPFKRVIDLLLVVVTAIVWVPITCVVAVAIYIDSGRPLIYRQTRVGRQGKPFTLVKFRTMVVNAEPHGPRFTLLDDPRLTRIGRVLRRSRLDELPQLWNVLVGDLSLVGPRPERPMFVERFASTIPFYTARHLIRPGITGWAQVHRGYGDSDEAAFDKLTYDLYYVKHASLWLDTRILGGSIVTVLRGSGAR